MSDFIHFENKYSPLQSSIVHILGNLIIYSYSTKTEGRSKRKFYFPVLPLFLVFLITCYSSTLPSSLSSPFPSFILTSFVTSSLLFESLNSFFCLALSLFTLVLARQQSYPLFIKADLGDTHVESSPSLYCMCVCVRCV